MTKLDRNTISKLPPPAPEKFDIVHWDNDLPGLGLRILKSGSRSWVVRFRVGRRQRVITLGKVSLLSPGQARTKASEILAKAKLGEDVSTEIRSKKAASGSTLEELI
ncbi:MAG: Arm DNA-binding domain-containing protein, partial [Geminicoccaceae bacterium]